LAILLATVGLVGCVKNAPGQVSWGEPTSVQAPAVDQLATELGLALDLGALRLLGSEQSELELSYLRRALEIVSSQPAMEAPLSRERYRVLNHHALRHTAGRDPATGDEWRAQASNEYLADLRKRHPGVVFVAPGYPEVPPLLEPLEPESVPIFITPTRAALEPMRLKLGLSDSSLNSPEDQGLPYGTSLQFDPQAVLDADPQGLVVPTPTRGRWRPQIDPLRSEFMNPFGLGKVVAQAIGTRHAELQLHRRSLAWSRRDMLEPLRGLYFGGFKAANGTRHSTWFVPIADAQGAARPWLPRWSPARGSWYQNTVNATALDFSEHDGRSDWAIVPRPRPPGSEPSSRKGKSRAGDPSEAYDLSQERVAVPLACLERPPFFVLAWKDESWRPLQEDLLLDRSLERFSRIEDRRHSTLQAVVINPRVSPRDLLELLSSLSGRDAPSSGAADVALQQLHAQVRTAAESR
jgi:hypothetical protein